jgi:hypothetical protein
VAETKTAADAFREKTVTASIDKYGGSISLGQSLLPGDVVLIRNLRGGLEQQFGVVGRQREIFGARKEYGVESLNPESQIWGVDFALPSEAIKPKIFIHCSEGKKEGLRRVFLPEYRVLLGTGLISQHCPQCGQTTRWRPSEQAMT